MANPTDSQRAVTSTFRAVLFLGAWLLALVVVTVSHAAVISGGPGGDYLVGTISHDHIEGRGGPDEIRGRAGGDWLEGNGGEDEIVGGRGDDLVFGGRGDDLVFVWGGRSGIDSVGCGAGGDLAYIGPKDGAARTCETVIVVQP